MELNIPGTAPSERLTKLNTGKSQISHKLKRPPLNQYIYIGIIREDRVFKIPLVILVNTIHLTTSGCTGGESCCTKDNKCNEQEGDCDSDKDCIDGLKCGTFNCVNKSGLEWDSEDSCCYDQSTKPGTNV